MRRRRTENDSSLELLLDTICNTFGGIVFISMLVVTLLNTTSRNVDQKPPPRTSQIELVRLEIKREQTARELERLRQAVADRKEALTGIISEDLVRLSEQLRRQQQERTRLTILASRQVGEMSKLQQQINLTLQGASKRKDGVAEMRRRVRQLEQEHNRLTRSRKKNVAKVRVTNKFPIIFLLKKGTLYGPFKLPGRAENTVDFSQQTDAQGRIILEPRKSGGAPIRVGQGVNSDVAGRLLRVPPKGCSIRLFVWDDSFEHCRVVRREIQRLGLGVELIPMGPDQVVQLGVPSGAPRLVQP